MHARNSATMIAIAAALAAGEVSAEPLPRSKVPGPLAPWVDWVLLDHERGLCPFLHGAADLRRECAWPAALSLSLDDAEGRFSQDFRAWVESWVALPGDAKRWPESVTVDGQPAAVIERDGAPALLLQPGAHTVAGVFRWRSLPEILPVPQETGLLALTVRGKKVEVPNRDDQGRLWVQKGSQGQGETRLEVIVHRRLEDSIPVVLTTRIELKVSGQSREVVLARALPERFVPMSLSAPLPARLDPDGRLRVQVRPGSFQIEVVARVEEPVQSVTLGAPDGPWDADEAWVFAAHPELREVAIEGVSLIDPEQTQLPPEWKGLPAYLVKPGDTLQAIERRRGDQDPAPDRLSLDRTFWLDFDGGGYTVKDRITGTFHRSWRLEMGEETSLGRVSIGAPGEPQQDQYINKRSPPGIEIRYSNPTIEADSRIEGARRDLSAVGWNHDFESVCGRIHLPPGWRLLHASGVDHASPTWVTRWDLLDDFLLLILAVSIGRLFGRRAGILALVALALSWHEPWAPRWVWLLLVAGEALARVVPEGKAKNVLIAYRWAMRGALVLIALPFLVVEVRAAAYPQLEKHAQHERFGLLDFAADKSLAPPAPPGAQAPREMEVDFEQREGWSEYSKKRPSKVVSLENVYAPDVRSQVTTGPGLPTWSWASAELTWRGPVDASQRLVLLMTPPWLTRSLEVLTAALVALLAMIVLGIPVKTWARRFAWPRGVPAALVAVGVGVLGARSVRAQEPQQQMQVQQAQNANIAAQRTFDSEQKDPSGPVLEELRRRLLQPPSCAPHCASAPRIAIEIAGAAMTVRVEVDAAAETAAPLPGGAQQWTPERVSLDGATARGLLRTTDGVLWIPLGRGAHQIVLEGGTGGRDTIELPLPLRPHRVESKLDGWSMDGVHEDGAPEDTLVLTRARAGAAGGGALEPGRLPPFVEVTREILFGLSWQVVTRVERKTPPGAAIVIEIPLLTGESVTSAEVRAQDDKALVSMGPNASEVSWTSVLADAKQLTLKAPSGVPWVEVWRVNAGPVWHVEPSGIPPVHAGEGGPRIREWRPWPGESVTLEITRPDGVPGQTTTVDSVSLVAKPGLRATDVTLSFGFRSSRGGQRTLKLPEGAELQSITVDGATQPLRQEGRDVTVPVAPGAHQAALTWRQPGGISAFWSTPSVDLGMPSVNANVVIEMPHDRWTLFVRGPRLGPAVLFWSLLGVFFLASLVLGRVPWTPLRARHWFLLLLGLTQVPIPVAAVVVLWLLALGVRKERAPEKPKVFNGVQIALPVLTLIALGCLFGSITAGLLGSPEMQISGNGSWSQHLAWYQDRSGGELPVGTAVSVPLSVYRLSMLAWALWLALALIGWLKWGWGCFTAGGIWRAKS